jgi:hypothetical protein
VLGGDCAAQMTSIRRQQGRPVDTAGPEQFAGDYTEVWYYASAGRIDRTYTFRWGASYPSCDVQGPTRFLRNPQERVAARAPSHSRFAPLDSRRS